MFEKNHYIQKRLLNNFAVQAPNGKSKICVLDLVNFSVDQQNTDSAFYERNLYDIHDSQNIKELELKFNENIEKPMTELFDRICKSNDEVIFTRRELATIKKYFLLQHSGRLKIKQVILIQKEFTLS